jgi:hypothetical protein
MFAERACLVMMPAKWQGAISIFNKTHRGLWATQISFESWLLSIVEGHGGEEGPMRLFIFKSEANPQLRAFGADPLGRVAGIARHQIRARSPGGCALGVTSRICS